jgi:ribosomal-protein-serine acetyltransferase
MAKMKPFLFEMKVGENSSLVIPQVANAAEIFSLIDGDRHHLRAWLPWVDSTTTVDDTRKNLADRIEGFEQKKQAAFYATLNGDFVASVGFISLNDGVGEIGYWLLSRYSGRGLMTAYVKKCVEYGFDGLGLQRIVIKCAEGNSKSAAIPQRLGFSPSETEGKRVRNGTEQHTLVFTLDKSDWSK